MDEAEPTSVVTDTAATQTDTMVSVPSPSNMNSTATTTQKPSGTSTAQQPAASSNTTTTNAGGTLNVRYVIARTTNTAYAYKRYAQLKSYGIAVSMDSVQRDTSTSYKIYLSKSLAPTDTARVKDSLSIYFVSLL